MPDKAEVLEAAWRKAIEAARAQLASLPLFIGGKSMGGRIASQVAAQGGNGTLAGLVYLGYPLHPPGNPAKRRDAHLPRIAEPMLFVQGSRDTFGTAGEIRSLLPSLQRASFTRSARVITGSRRRAARQNRNRCSSTSSTPRRHGCGTGLERQPSAAGF